MGTIVGALACAVRRARRTSFPGPDQVEWLSVVKCTTTKSTSVHLATTTTTRAVVIVAVPSRLLRSFRRWWWIARVSLHVSLQVACPQQACHYHRKPTPSVSLTLLRESLSAQMARESVVLVVCAHVCHHVALLREGLAAHMTREGFLLRVHRPDVCLQVACERYQQQQQQHYVNNNHLACVHGTHLSA